ncbi:MAG: hypothetical protein IPK82_38320 [Polyangiaceae bacterium]|nr:hypothetical protein [Polyangiaceae bacterium]
MSEHLSAAHKADETNAGFRRGLSPRAERVAASAMEAILADEDERGNLIPGSPEACARAVRWLSRSAGHSSSNIRFGYGLLTWLLQLLPLFMIGVPSRMTELSLGDRIRYLTALETSRYGLLSMLLLAFKVPMSIVAFEEGAELSSTGFDRPSTASRRSLMWAEAPPANAPNTAGGVS